MISIQLHCDHCQWWTLCGDPDLVRRLRKIGVLRRAESPPEDLVRELLNSHGAQLTCDRCQRAQLRFVDGAPDDEGDWQQARLCEVCREPIAPERIEFLPSTTRCTVCQDASDRGVRQIEPEFCPKCGALAELRVSSAGGITRYKLFCTNSPACRI
jgi:RNA polymerase-binding transcription factor DksA